MAGVGREPAEMAGVGYGSAPSTCGNLNGDAGSKLDVELMQTFRCEGNALFKERNWTGAFSKYSQCIRSYEAVGKEEGLKKRTSEDFKNVMLLAYSNRAEVMLQLGLFQDAEADASKALEFDPTHVKSLSRLGRAAREMGLYKKACDAFKAALAKCPDDASLIENLKASRVCLKNLRTKNHGQKPSRSSERSSGCNTEASCTCTESIGPVEVRRVDYGDGRRGLFTTEPVKVRTQLLWGQPLAAVATEDPNDSFGGTFGPGPHRDIVVQLLRQAVSSKRSMAQLYSLVSVGKKEMEVPSMKLFDSKSKWVPPPASTLELDANLIEEIARSNSLSWTNADFSYTMWGGARDGGEDGPLVAGLWILPSFINHSCAPNSMQTCLGSTKRNIKMIHSAREIGVAEEVTISYFQNLFSGLEARQDEARKLYFTCACERCVLEGRLKAEFSEVSTQVSVLVPASKDEFSGGRGMFRSGEAMHQVVNEGEAELGALNFLPPGTATDNTGWAWANYLQFCHANGALLVTRELASLADRVEALIASLGTNILSHQRGWIRAGFLEAYLAKYQQATLGPDVSTRISTLNIILDSMMSVWITDAALVVAQLLLHEVNCKYSRESKTYKRTKDLVLRVIRGI